MRNLLALQGVERKGVKVAGLLGYRETDVMPAPALRQVLTTLVERVELDPKTREFTIRYRLPVNAKPELSWRPHGDSNPGYRRERAVS